MAYHPPPAAFLISDKFPGDTDAPGVRATLRPLVGALLSVASPFGAVLS